jgi:Spy/CpxP family protein refolding chaperone
MKRTLLMLSLGLAVGTIVHFGYFGLHEGGSGDALDRQLSWMKSELQLTDQQYARIKELHRSSSPRLRALAVQVAQLQTEFAAFERVRHSADRVDFLEFARFVEERRHVSRECLDSTRQLVLASAEVMTPQQREHYLGLIATAEPLPRPLLN